jgi:uncharacterized LabA/DUF88 family protein
MKNISSAVRVAVLIDGSNVYRTAQSMGIRVDYSKILERLNGRQIVRAVMYLPDTGTQSQKGFIAKLRSLGMEVKTKDIKEYPDGKRKCDMDLDLAIDAVCMAEKVDVISLISMDGDFCPLVCYLQSKGAKVEAVGFASCVSGDLRRAVDEFIPINDEMLLEEPKRFIREAA